MKTFGEILREKRMQRGWTLQYVSDAVGCQLSSLGLYERDIRYPNIMIVWSLADLYECSIDELCGRIQEADNERGKKKNHK